MLPSVQTLTPGCLCMSQRSKVHTRSCQLGLVLLGDNPYPIIPLKIACMLGIINVGLLLSGKGFRVLCVPPFHVDTTIGRLEP